MIPDHCDRLCTREGRRADKVGRRSSLSHIPLYPPLVSPFSPVILLPSLSPPHWHVSRHQGVLAPPRRAVASEQQAVQKVGCLAQEATGGYQILSLIFFLLCFLKTCSYEPRVGALVYVRKRKILNFRN